MLQNLMRKMKRNDKGFTLVELMIVVVIIGILIAIAIPIYNSIQTSAEQRACDANRRTIRSQMEVYKADINDTTYGDAVDTAADLTAFLADPDYFAEEPDCPVSTGVYSMSLTTFEIYCTVHNIAP